MNTIFISYAREDEGVVRRMYDDLKRLGISVWEFKTEGKYGIHYVDEFKEQIKHAEYFCLLDSEHARNANCVQIETNHAYALNKKILICRLQEVINGIPLFPDHNFITWFSLYEDYDSGLEQLCSHLGVLYSPLFTHPRDQDFIWEMGQLQMDGDGITTKDWRKLVESYTEFRQSFEADKQYSEANLVTVISKCRSLGLKLISPSLALAHLLEVQYRYQEAIDVYKTICRDFPGDPRIFAGIGKGYFRLSMFTESVHAYTQCLQLILQTTVPTHREHLVDIAHNLYQALLEGGLNQGEVRLIDPILQQFNDTPEIVALRGKLSIRAGDLSAGQRLLEFACRKLFPSFTDTPLAALYFCNTVSDLSMIYVWRELFFDQIRLLTNVTCHLAAYLDQRPDDNLKLKCAEMYCSLGSCYLNGFSDYDSAVFYYQKAIRLVRKLKFLSELAMIFKTFNECNKMMVMLDECFLLERNNLITSGEGEDTYYLGLAYYLAKKNELAQNKYALSGMKAWKYYDQLMP